MTRLSVNLNKIALLRNARGRDYPNVVTFAEKFVDLGVAGLTIHPRPDARHIKFADAYALGAFCRTRPAVELNIEGYPDADFLALIDAVRPDQCTLVPDTHDQLTSDRGWDLTARHDLLTAALARIHQAGARSALFIDPNPSTAEAVAAIGAARVELYTAEYAKVGKAALPRYQQTAHAAHRIGLGINAGHDLDLTNLQDFLTIAPILEVSIGHALTVECIELGMTEVVARYLQICGAA